MARIECYVSDKLKEKISKIADAKSTSVSKLITQILENHFSTGESQAVFQEKVMATLCDIYACVFDESVENTNHDAVIARMKDIKKQCEEAVLNNNIE